MQTQWNELLVSALLGTEQRQAAVVSPELEFLTTGNATGNATEAVQTPEAWLLLASAYACSYRRAGQIPPEIQRTQLVPAASPETKPLCSAKAAARLANLLEQVKTHELFLEEFLKLLGHKNRLVPPVMLPDLFTWAKREKRRRALIVPVMGERGRWLVAYNPEWKNMLVVNQADMEALAMITTRASEEQAIIELLKLEFNTNIFSRVYSLINQHSGDKVVQAIVDKLLANSKDATVRHSEQAFIHLASVMPRILLPEIIEKLQHALTQPQPKGLLGLSLTSSTLTSSTNVAQVQQVWLPGLIELLDYRHQMLKELANE